MKIGTPFVVFDDPDNMDPDTAQVARFMGVTSLRGVTPVKVAVSYLTTRGEDVNLDASRLFPCDIAQPPQSPEMLQQRCVCGAIVAG